MCYFNSKLSNDPGKVESNFFCYAVMYVSSPHRNVLIFYTENALTYRKACLRNKMYLNSISKGFFVVCVKRFCNWSILKVYNFISFPHRISVLIRLRPDFVIWKLFGNVVMNMYTAWWSFLNFCCLSQSKIISTNKSKGSTLLYSNMFTAVVAFLFIWTVN